MNRRVRQKRGKRDQARDRFGTDPTTIETTALLGTALRASADAGACRLTPGIWRPPEPPAVVSDDAGNPILNDADELIVCEEAAAVNRASACPQKGDATEEGNSNQVSSTHRVHPISASAKNGACIVLRLPITRNWQQIKAKMPKN